MKLPGFRTVTKEQWLAEGRRRFGADMHKWKFVCPCCKHVATVSDWKDSGAPQGGVAFSCVGVWLPAARAAFGGEGSGPCKYQGGGTISLNPVNVDGNHFFEFAVDA
jgi:hypothetical protein